MMQLLKCKKAGYTLVEVLIVVSIMGILSSMGVVSLRAAVANSRVKDAAINTSAFLERVANLSKERSDLICLAIDPTSAQTLLAVKSVGSDCSTANKMGGGILDKLVIDAPTKFVQNSSATCNFVGDIDMTKSSDAVIKPRIGLSAVPHGIVCVQYDNDDRFGIARKAQGYNNVKAFWKIGNSDGAHGWIEL